MHGVEVGSTAVMKDQILVACSGVGPERAAAAARNLIAEGAELLVSWGTATGLRADIRAGALIVPARVVAEGHAWESDTHLHERLRDRLEGARYGDLADTDTLLDTRRAREALADRTGCIAADMESAAIVRSAAEAGVRHITVRAVADPLNRPLPPSIASGFRADGSIDRWAVARRSLFRPSELLILLRIAMDFSRAAAALRSARRPLVEVARQSGMGVDDG